MFKRFISYYKPHKLMFTLDMLAALGISLVGLFYPIVTRRIMKNYLPDNNLKMIVISSLVLFACYLIRMYLKFFVQYYGHVMGVKMQAQMRREMFFHLERLPYSYYDNNETGRIMSRMTNDLMDISELAHHGPENFFICGLTVILSLIYLFTINWQFTLIITGAIPLMVIVSIVMRKKMNKAFMESRVATASINASLESSITGIRVTKAFTNESLEQEKFEVGNLEFVEAKRKSYKAMGLFGSSTGFVVDIFNVILILAGGLFLYYGKIEVADFTAFITAVAVFITPLTTLINFIEQFEQGVTGFTRFVEIIDERPESESENAKDIEIEGNVTFSDVSFQYVEDKGVLNHINLDVKKGEILALVGPSGGGKTTICHLIPNFYKVSSGEIKIDGVNINDITFKSLRGQIGIVQQDVFLFGGTIKENILYGRLDATDDEVYEAARRANIHDYIMSLPNKYDTAVGERGVRLSGGQKQRLSIARVFLKNPKILILDEATSALDNTTEILIQKALDNLCKGRTTFVVAHRLSTIKNATRICVVSEGNIVEEGSHEELLNKNGAYKKLYDAQFKTLDDDITDLNETLKIA